jgi:DNA-binding YbaB/EbfC family protein
MKDIMGLMSKAKEMQEKMQAMQEDLVNLEVEGSAGGDMVKIRLNGKGALVGITIDPSMIKPDEADILKDLIIAAHTDAKAKVEEETALKTQELTAGLPIPPGMKLPF